MEKITNFVESLVKGELYQGDIDSFVSCLKRGLLEAELNELKSIADGQIAYMHPLKLATQAKQNNMGHHNLAVFKLLNQLKTTDKVGRVLQEIKNKCTVK